MSEKTRALHGRGLGAGKIAARHVLRETAVAVAVAAVLALAIRTWVVEPFVVQGPSMENTLQSTERVLVDKFWWLSGPLRYGEIVVFHPPIPGDTKDYIKRVIAVGGQTVSMRNGSVYVNGIRMPQPFLRHNGVSTKDHWTMPRVRVPKGELFVLGDHRAVSEDSRYFGFVKLSAVKGVAFWSYWPPSDFGPVR